VAGVFQHVISVEAVQLSLAPILRTIGDERPVIVKWDFTAVTSPSGIFEHGLLIIKNPTDEA